MGVGYIPQLAPVPSSSLSKPFRPRRVDAAPRGILRTYTTRIDSILSPSGKLGGGVEGDRTPDLGLAKPALSRLSYYPVRCLDMPVTVEWWVYVIQSQKPRFNSKGLPLQGFYYVGATTDPVRRLRMHNGEIKGGGKYTAQHRPWLPRALYGPYGGKSDALKAEYALKHSKRAVARTLWTPKDSDWCRGLGAKDPWVTGTNAEEVLAAAAPSAPAKPYRGRRRRRRRRSSISKATR